VAQRHHPWSTPIPQVDDDHIVKDATAARAGVTEHGVRYVLVFGTFGAIALFVAVYLLVSG
jgi:hypothetical protein